jgi:phage-related minor tail protein
MVKGGFQAYANGGIATKPTLGLVGEGRYNEAIVPMPNGKAIPVDMKGAGQQNNVTVNVSVDSQGGASTNMQQDSAQAGNLGQVIARAVQQELQNQKRSGGILNPYGAA